MKKLIVKLLTNKKNGQVNISLPKKEFSTKDRKKLCSIKTARVWLEDFD